MSLTGGVSLDGGNFDTKDNSSFTGSPLASDKMSVTFQATSQCQLSSETLVDSRGVQSGQLPPWCPMFRKASPVGCPSGPNVQKSMIK